MFKQIFFIILSLCLLALAQVSVFSQEKTEWIRVQSDNGEFSIEVPSDYAFFTDNDGFTVSESFKDHTLQEMKMLNAFSEKTLVSFESYRATKDALDAMREKETWGKKVTEVKTGDFKYKQVILETQDSYAVKKYFSSKNFIYILTAASRKGETAAMKRFFDSLIFRTDAKTPDTTSKATRFSDLKTTPIEINADKTSPNNSNPPMPTVEDDEILKLVVVSKPNVSYTDAARQSGQQGKIRMRITFSKEGRISKLSVLETLKDGLLRQAVFAAIRVKFLPQEKNGEPVTVTKIIEYSFNIY